MGRGGFGLGIFGLRVGVCVWAACGWGWLIRLPRIKWADWRHHVGWKVVRLGPGRRAGLFFYPPPSLGVGSQDFPLPDPIDPCCSSLFTKPFCSPKHGWWELFRRWDWPFSNIQPPPTSYLVRNFDELKGGFFLWILYLAKKKYNFWICIFLELRPFFCPSHRQFNTEKTSMCLSPPGFFFTISFLHRQKKSYICVFFSGHPMVLLL